VINGPIPRILLPLYYGLELGIHLEYFPVLTARGLHGSNSIIRTLVSRRSDQNFVTDRVIQVGRVNGQVDLAVHKHIPIGWQSEVRLLFVLGWVGVHGQGRRRNL
jgi:hypothetical protein